MKSDITIVLDRSGSMELVAEDTIGGFNAFIKSQQGLPGEASVSLIQFDDRYEVEYSGKPLKDVPTLTTTTFRPRGSTALLDAIGRTITETGARLAALPEADRPSKVILVIITDGFENASQRFNRAQVFGMISHQRDTYQWDVVFIGANQDAIAEGGRLGVPQAASLTYGQNPAGVAAAFASMSNYVAHARSGLSATFSKRDREAALGRKKGH